MCFVPWWNGGARSGFTCSLSVTLVALCLRVDRKWTAQRRFSFVFGSGRLVEASILPEVAGDSFREFVRW